MPNFFFPVQDPIQDGYSFFHSSSMSYARHCVKYQGSSSRGRQRHSHRPHSTYSLTGGQTNRIFILPVKTCFKEQSPKGGEGYKRALRKLPSGRDTCAEVWRMGPCSRAHCVCESKEHTTQQEVYKDPVARQVAYLRSVGLEDRPGVEEDNVGSRRGV